jgi:hypothetical protein
MRMLAVSAAGVVLLHARAASGACWCLLVPQSTLDNPMIAPTACNSFHAACPQRVRDALVTERERLLAGLREIPFLQPYPSHANFVLAKVAEGRDARAIKEALATDHGIMVSGLDVDPLAQTGHCLQAMAVVSCK